MVFLPAVLVPRAVSLSALPPQAVVCLTFSVAGAAPTERESCPPGGGGGLICRPGAAPCLLMTAEPRAATPSRYCGVAAVSAVGQLAVRSSQLLEGTNSKRLIQLISP